MNVVQIASAVTAAKDRICGEHRQLEVTTKFEKLRRELLAEKGEHLKPEMTPLRNDLTAGNAFYIVVRNNDDGSLAAICGARLHLLGSDSFATFIERQYARLYGGGEPVVDADDIVPEMHAITGRVGYLGDLRVYHSKGVPPINLEDLTLLLYCVTAMKFDIDWLCYFMKMKSNQLGMGARYGAPVQLPHALRWLKQVEGRRDDDVFACISRDHLERAISKAAAEGYVSLNARSADRKALGSAEPHEECARG